MATPYAQNINPADDWVIFKATDLESGHEEIIVAADVNEAASIMTSKHGARLVAYDRIAYIDRRPAVKMFV